MSEQQYTYLTTEQLAARIHYQPATILKSLKDSMFLEGEHYVRPFGGRKVIFIWERVEQPMLNPSRADTVAIPMANGGVAHV